MGRLIDEDVVVKIIDKHTYGQNQLDEDITCILEEVPTAYVPDRITILPVPFEATVYTVDLNTSGDYEVFDWEFSAVKKDGYVLTSQFSEIELSHVEFKEKVFLDKKAADKRLMELRSLEQVIKSEFQEINGRVGEMKR